MAESLMAKPLAQQDIDPRLQSKIKLLRDTNKSLVEKIGVTDLGGGLFYITAYYQKGAGNKLKSEFEIQLEKEIKSLDSKATVLQTPDESKPVNSTSWSVYLPPKKKSGQLGSGFL